ncbi:hypothetical protein KFK09_015804 [Dendrobium nobile]|uniref:Uncharacterized protein n=1 Tax=Dendrobium nobile TaxID=94219 RepID=A0A8T3B5U0_DENNO|nr:hypothetical protein KFK09_015804 [Dendrobium nobile]
MTTYSSKLGSGAVGGLGPVDRRTRRGRDQSGGDDEAEDRVASDCDQSADTRATITIHPPLNMSTYSLVFSQSLTWTKMQWNLQSKEEELIDVKEARRERRRRKAKKFKEW